MAARIASKSRSKIATPDLSRSLQRGISVASGNLAHQESVRRPKQCWVACRPPHCSPVRSPVRRTSASAFSTSAAAASASSIPPATATAASTSTAATEAPTSATTPTPTPSSSSTATTAAPTTSSSSLAPPALADASEGLGFESQCVRFGHPNAGGCQRSTRDPQLIPDKGYKHVGLEGYGRTHPLHKQAILSQWPLGPLATATATTATATTATAATAATAAPACSATMASLRFLTFDHEGRPVQFDTWLDDLQLYLLSDSKDSVSLFDHKSGAAPAPPATADSATRSPWLTRDAAARLAIRNHLPLAECAHFGQHKTAQALYAAVPPMFITLYFIVTRLPDSLSSVRDQFLSLDPTSLTIDLLEQHLLAAETSGVAVGAARGTPHPPFFEGCSPSPLAPSYASAATADVSVAEDLGAASASALHRISKGKGSRGGGGGSGGGGGGSGSGGGGSSGGSGGSGGGGGGGNGGGRGGSSSGGGGSGGSGGSGGGGTGGGRTGPRHGGPGGGQRQQQQRRSETQSPQQLREWLFQRGTSGGSDSCPYVIPTGVRIGQTCGKLHTQHRCFSRLDDAWRAEFGDDVELPRWADLLSAEGDFYRCVPPDLGIAAAALGASESGTLPSTAPAQALHTFTLDSGASRCFFRDSTTLTPLPATVPVRFADPSGGPVVARSSTVFPCPAVPSDSLSGLHLPSFSTNLVSTTALQDAMVTTTTLGGQRVSICTYTRTAHHLATFTRRPRSSLYTLTTEHPHVAASAQVSASGQVAASCSCRFLSHQTLLWHHRLGHPSLPRLRGMHSRLLVSGLPRSLPPLPPSPALPCLPCVEGQQRAAPHSSSFPPMSAPLQTLHMDVCGSVRKGQVVDVLIPWIRTVRLQLRERFGQDLPVLRLHSDRGGEFSSNLLRDFCRGEGILQSFMIPDSPQQNGIAERRIGLVMEVARTSMIHAAAPHFLWPLAVWYAAHQLNIWPRVSVLETSPTLRWTGGVGDTSVFRVWGFRAFVRDTSADKLSARDIPCVFLGFVPDMPDPLPPQGPAPSGVSQVDPLPRPAPAEVAPGGAESEGAGSGGAEPGGVGPGGAEPAGVEPEGVEPGGAESEGAESRGAEPRDAASSGATGAGDAGVTAGSGGACTRGTRAAGTETGAVDHGAGGAGDNVRPRLYFVPLLQQVLGVPSSPSLTPPLLCPPPDQSQLPLQPASPLPAPSPYTDSSGGLIERRDPASRPVSPIRTALRVPRSHPSPVPGMHAMILRPSFVPLRVPLPAPPESSLPEVPDPATDRARGVSPTVTRLLAAAVTDPSFESAATSAFVAELVDFAAACRLDYATSLVAQSESASPPSVGGECALGTDVLEDRQEDFECLAAAVPRFASMLLAPKGDPDAPDIPTPRSYAEAITGLLRLTLYVDDLLVATADTEALTLVKSELEKRHTCTDLGEVRSYLGLHITRDRAQHTNTLTESHMVHQVLQRFGFQFSSPQPTPLSTSHLLSAPPSDESVEPSGPYPELVGCLMYVMSCTRPDLAYPLNLLAHYVAPGRQRKVHWDAAKRVLRYLCSTSGMGLVLGGRGPVVLTCHANASWVHDSAT
ncbi:unnamed protein product [Closterium sp. NIES-54]